MDETTLKTDFKGEVKRALLRLRDQPILHDFMAITFLFMAFKIAASIVLTFIDAKGFRAIHSLGGSYDKPVSAADIPFYQSLTSDPSITAETVDVSLSDIAGALNEAHPDIVPDALRFSFETAPLLSGMMSAFILCAYALPLIYFILNMSNDRPRPMVRRIIQILVTLGGAAWAVALYANGHWIRTPVDMIKSAGFWLIQGALCLHLFTDIGSKARRAAQPLGIMSILLIIGAVNLIVSGRLFGSGAGLHPLETEQLHNAMTSGWWASLHDGLTHVSGYTCAIFIILFLVGDNLLDFLLKRQPLLRTLLGWVVLSILLVIGCSFLGVVINSPSQVLIWQAVFFVLGMGCLRSMAQKPEHAAQAKSIIDHFLSRLDRAPALPDRKG